MVVLGLNGPKMTAYKWDTNSIYIHRIGCAH